MNLLTRTMLFSPSTMKRTFPLYLLTRTPTPLQQCSFYSTKATLNTQQLTKSKTKRSSEPSLTFSQRVKKQADSLAAPVPVWPKPREIPYQEKVANFVNLIGFVKTPVHSEAASDGTHFAATVISQENAGGKKSFMIPVVFQGDLAHVVASHVKENDCVFVSGLLSVQPLKLALSESLGKFHVVAENLNFVEGFKKNVSNIKIEDLGGKGVKKIEEVTKSSTDYEEFNRRWRESLEQAKEKKAPSTFFNKDYVDLNANNAEAMPELSLKPPNEESKQVKGYDKAMPEPSLKPPNDESKQVKGYEKSGENANKKKSASAILDLWRDLVKNPLQWWDYRGHKSNGLVKERYPDFKQKATDEALWLNTAPAWALPGLGKLEFDVKNFGGTRVQEVQGTDDKKVDAKGEDPWKVLVENPNKWWDNRIGKRYPKSPDFKHKETHVGLWVSSAPKWALSKLPPVKESPQ